MKYPPGQTSKPDSTRSRRRHAARRNLGEAQRQGLAFGRLIHDPACACQQCQRVQVLKQPRPEQANA